VTGIDRAILDSIGPWSRVKHDIIRRYATEYSRILRTQVAGGTLRGYTYVDAFAGAGTHVEKATGLLVPGSARIALDIVPPFTHYYFIDLDRTKVDELRRAAAERANAEVIEGDCNRVLLKHVLPRVRWGDRQRALCLLDPYHLQLSWEVVHTAGQMGSVEIFLNFPVYDININVLRKGGPVSDTKAAEMTTFWGDETWRERLYVKDVQLEMFGDTGEATKLSNERVAQAYRDRLKSIAGFPFVPEPLPMKNSTNSTVYYLFFASPNETGRRIVQHIFDRYRSGGFDG
jgi:three-Cys-motif partner protein